MPHSNSRHDGKASRKSFTYLAIGLLGLQVTAACSSSEGDAGLGGASSTGGASGSGGGEAATGGSSGLGGAPPTPAAPGFRADYFFQYRELVHTAVEPSVQHVWAGETPEPAAGVGEDSFSARWSATLHVEAAGTYRFATMGDDGVRLWIGDELIIDDWRSHFAERHEGEIELAAGEVSVRLEYFETNLDAELALFWTPPGAEEELLDERFVTVAEGGAVGPKPPYRNAVIAANRPDPGVLADEGLYYMVSTGGQFRIRRSYDLVMWEDTDGVVLPNGKPSWAANGGRNWAPELHKVGSKYVAYYTSVNGADVLSVGAASADSPTGPYTDRGSPLVEHAQGVIDANYFEDSDGKRYLTYKIDGNAHGQPTPIYLRELSADGLSFAPGSAQVEILRNDASTWEGGVVEGQWIVKYGGTYFLFYSGNVYDQRYRTGVARSNDVAGPYEKFGNPILANNATWVGPGHGSVVPAGDDLYFVYHAWPSNGEGGRDAAAGRHVLVDRIVFDNGWPKISDGTPSTTHQPWPGFAP
ncbi:MAG TPA: family 43 glycosylhydrolase [Polyangiaceae bacterium]|nr:family 43 glycosylhydrolase [Polyangiaceae bacterium]